MRVVKNPDYQELEPWIITVKCRGDDAIKVEGCGAELEITKKDLKLFHYYGTHFKHEYLSVKCPFCGAIIQKLKIPDHVVKQWEKKHPRAESEFDGFDDRI